MTRQNVKISNLVEVPGNKKRGHKWKIARDDGGLVEAYPVTKKNTVKVWFGSVGMFLERRFEIISDFGRSNVLVRKIIKTISE